MTDPLQYDIDRGLARITLDQPPVNSLGRAMREAVHRAVQRALDDDTVKLIIIGSSQKVFCGGADITEFDKPGGVPAAQLSELLSFIEDAGKPVVAAINGVVLGGGLELALACDYRFAAPAARLGFPEVNLGLIPGGGGTQRLPRLTGVQVALDMITSGKPVSAATALDLGLVDGVAQADGDFDAQATAYARDLMANDAPFRSCADIVIDPDSVENGLFDTFRERIADRTRGYPAPECAIQAIEFAVGRPLAEGLARESVLFGELSATPQARALQHLFFAERASRRVPGVDPKLPRRDIGSVGIVGAGTMGGGIAMCCANAGLPVTLVEISAEALDRGLDTIRARYAASVKRGKLKDDDAERCLELIDGTIEFDRLADADLVIEAVFERLDIKEDVFRRLDATCKPGAILATNTSYQDVNAIAAATTRSDDVVGLHFFSPANVMRLLEVVRGDDTADDVLLTALDLGKRLGKVPVVSGVCHGFIGNRMLEPYAREAERLLLEGATPAQVDRALTDFGFAMGPFAVMDLAGIDVFSMARQGNREAWSHQPGYAAVSARLNDMGRFGQKSGRGFYRYEGREAIDDPEATDIATGIAAELGVARREISEKEIIERCVYPLIDEGARILEDGIALRSGDIDLVWVNGYGFPRWRGGPMHHADEIGASTVLDGLVKYREVLGDYGETWFEPSNLLRELAGSGRKFDDVEGSV